MEEIVHFALSHYTACNQHVVGSTVFSEDGGDNRVSAGCGTNVQHTCIPENVTCPKCKDSIAFKNHLKTLYD